MQEVGESREVDVNKRTVATHFYSLLQRIRFDHFIFFSFLGHILTQIKISHNLFQVKNFLVTFL